MVESDLKKHLHSPEYGECRCLDVVLKLITC